MPGPVTVTMSAAASTVVDSRHEPRSGAVAQRSTVSIRGPWRRARRAQPVPPRHPSGVMDTHAIVFTGLSDTLRSAPRGRMGQMTYATRAVAPASLVATPSSFVTCRLRNRNTAARHWEPIVANRLEATTTVLRQAGSGMARPQGPPVRRPG